MVNFSPSYTIKQTDEAVNKLIDHILTMGEESITGKVKNKHAKDAILMRQNEINAVMNRIKPGLLSIFARKFTKERIMDYLVKVRNKTLDTQKCIASITKEKNNISV
jgi:hypothetical protein